MIADQFERAAHEEAGVPCQFALTHRVRVPDDLVRVRRAAINHGAVAVGLELRAWRILRRPERGEELVLVPRPEQDVITPLRIRVFDPVFSQLRGLLDGRDAGHITEPARVRAPHRHVERPIRQALVNEIVLRDNRRRMPETDATLMLDLQFMEILRILSIALCGLVEQQSHLELRNHRLLTCQSLARGREPHASFSPKIPLPARACWRTAEGKARHPADWI